VRAAGSAAVLGAAAIRGGVAADLRAPTPSAAAELITEAQHKIAEHLANQEHRLERAAHFQLLQARQRLSRLSMSPAEGRISSLLYRLEQRLDDFSFRLQTTVSAQVLARQRQVAELAATVLRHDPRQKLGLAREHLAACRTRLDRTFERLMYTSAARLSALNARLHTLSPLAVLDRGYALVLDASGGLVRSTAQVAPGDQVTTRLADGSFTSRVQSATPNKSNKK